MRNRAIRSKWGGRKNGASDASASAAGTANGNGRTGGRGGDGSNLKQSFDRYVEMAKAAASSGDAVESEKYYQYADHFLRLMKATAH